MINQSLNENIISCQSNIYDSKETVYLMKCYSVDFVFFDLGELISYGLLLSSSPFVFLCLTFVRMIMQLIAVILGHLWCTE
jgi:hypothetical protein